jgi:hypothetical protein
LTVAPASSALVATPPAAILVLGASVGGWGLIQQNDDSCAASARIDQSRVMLTRRNYIG